MSYKVIFFSGAGLSAESGIPTFRSKNGLWDDFDINIVCNIQTWQDNIDAVHDFYNTHRIELSLYKPNSAHETIARVQKTLGKEDVIVITQNVDDLLERAGCEDVIHVHGELTKMLCTDCNYQWEIGYNIYDFKNSHCPKCNGIEVKPHVVFFYEAAPMYERMFDVFNKIEKDTTIIIIGTSGSVVSIDMFLSEIDAHLILNNKESSQYINDQKFEHTFYENATTALPKIETILYERYR